MRSPLSDSAAVAFRRRYGASTLHLLLVLASFALAVYAGLRLLRGDTLGVALWFVGAALLHDLVLLPLYSVTDRAVQVAFGSASDVGGTGMRVSVNYVRVPAFVAGVLLLVWWPLILRRVDHFTAATGLPADGFLARWLLITAGLFTASAAVLLVRMRHRTRAARRAARVQARARRATK
ncbi:hypothetical protein OG264_32935 [Streptomyces xanthophaeus]|uniref:hypothetical protein n=1 Tax=Streptomyces xanthophaeus TaxID=67385 RepID=UPI0038682D81|nr:hypothetical protein OG264_32935 [Streptomyces xanthophaeus]WST59134.1 hypothetical protein OG605_05505 [Streptomyces xanthophaeus]